MCFPSLCRACTAQRSPLSFTLAYKIYGINTSPLFHTYTKLKIKKGGPEREGDFPKVTQLSNDGSVSQSQLFQPTAGLDIPPKTLQCPCWVLESADSSHNLQIFHHLCLQRPLSNLRVFNLWLCVVPCPLGEFDFIAQTRNYFTVKAAKKRARKGVNRGSAGSENNFRGDGEPMEAS